MKSDPNRLRQILLNLLSKDIPILFPIVFMLKFLNDGEIILIANPSSGLKDVIEIIIETKTNNLK